MHIRLKEAQTRKVEAQPSDWQLALVLTQSKIQDHIYI